MVKIILSLLIFNFLVIGCNEKKKKNLFPLGVLALAINGGSSGPEQVATPTFSPDTGSYFNTPTTLTISTTTSGANIYFTIDGTTPTASSNLYSSAIHIWFLTGKIVQAIATKTGMIDSAVATLPGMSSYPPLQTGQTTVYTVGDNGTHQSGVSRSYTDNGNGTITDNATGLVWQKCFKGRNNDATCSDNTSVTDTATWEEAKNYCSTLNLAGNTWRLPTRQELETLPDYSKSKPAIDTTIFPATANNPYWTSSIYAIQTQYTWTVPFDYGTVDYDSPSLLGYVRCVSGDSKGYVGNFIDNGDGTIKDQSTGIIWQKCSRGQNNDATCSGAATTSNWSAALSYCSGLGLASRSWRLPTVNELKTIVDTTKSNGPTIDSTFPNTVESNYWSSTTFEFDTSIAFDVHFNYGYISYIGKTASVYVRCVSGP